MTTTVCDTTAEDLAILMRFAGVSVGLKRAEEIFESTILPHAGPGGRIEQAVMRETTSMAQARCANEEITALVREAGYLPDPITSDFSAVRSEARGYHITITDNYASRIENDTYANWDENLKAGRSYLVGNDVPMEDFIRKHSSALTPWQKRAFEWAKANPKFALNLRNDRYEWSVYLRGEYVTFALPHQDAGGERHYACRDGRSKVLVNVD